MTVTLNRSVGGYPAGATVTFDTPTEAAIVQQLAGTVTAAGVTAGAITTTQNAGRVGVPVGVQSVVVTNPMVTAQSKINAYINQATADTGFTTVVRIVPAAGSFTIYGNANAAAITYVDWAVESLSGLTAVN